MNSVMLLIAFALPVFSAGVTSIVFKKTYQSKLAEKEKKIFELTERVEKLNETIRKTERRNAFRLKVSKNCHFQPIKIGNKKVQVISETEMYEGVINDISFSGLQLETTIDMEIKQAIEIWIDFELKNHKLQLKGLIVRKEDNIKNKNIIYGIKFVNNKMDLQNKLNQLIRLKEIEKKRLGSS